MDLTIFTVTYNEELLIQMMIDHWRLRFPKCHIVVYDNQSTDQTVEIAKANGCEIRHYDSGGQVNDQMLWNTKNSVWRTAKTDWVVVCDLDEMLDITAEQLKAEDTQGVTKIKCECWHMVNMEDNLDVRRIAHGARNPKDTVYDKDLMFNKKFVEINYVNNDCHFTQSKGKIKNSKPYKMYHYKYVNPDIFVAKQKISASRLSEINKKNGWGAQCLRNEEDLRTEFQQARNSAVKVYPGSFKDEHLGATLAKAEIDNKMQHFYQNIQGWFGYPNLYKSMAAQLPNGAHIVEIGAWKGRSTAYMGVEIINSGKNIKFDVIDTWTGDVNDPTSFHTDKEFMDNNRNILELFKKNVAPILHILNPIQSTSVDAAKAYQDKSLDFVLIDAGHSYEDVKTDILTWLPKVKSGGTIAGDDYNPNSFPGVVKAVHEIFPKEKISFVDSCWVVKV